jgi:hypothetical protein
MGMRELLWFLLEPPLWWQVAWLDAGGPGDWTGDVAWWALLILTGIIMIAIVH